MWPPIGTRLIDSVPPATIADAEPHMMRSAANAIACRPDEQKRLTVTADAVTGHAGAQARDARDVQALLGLRHRAPEDHVVDLGGIDARRAAQRFGDDGGGELVGPRAAQRAVRRLADRRADGGNDDGVVHGRSSAFRPVQSPSRSSIASATSLTLPSNR